MFLDLVATRSILDEAGMKRKWRKTLRQKTPLRSCVDKSDEVLNKRNQNYDADDDEGRSRRTRMMTKSSRRRRMNMMMNKMMMTFH